jgi:Uma2 family endonuclease
MSALAPSTPQELSLPAEPIWRLTIQQYHEMIEAGILTDNDPVELLEGWLVTKMPKNPSHSFTTQLTRDALDQILPYGWFINIQEPITLADSEPEPDVIVVRGERRDYLERHPGPAEVALIIEVADATLRRDRITKKRMFAEARIPVYWVINLPGRQFEVYTNPSGEGRQADYQERQLFRQGDEVPVVIDGREVGRLSVEQLLP